MPSRKTTKTASKGSTAAPTRTPASAAGAPAFAPPPKMRRRPLLWLIGVGLVLLSALTAVMAYRSLGQGHDIVAVRSTIHRGEVISREDLMTVRVGLDPALNPIPAAQLTSAVGKRAALDVAAGGVLTQEAVTATVLPPTGKTLIGVQLTTAQMPSEDLRAGDRVRLIALPQDRTGSPEGTPDTIAGTVVATSASPRGDGRIVDVTVTESVAPTWAARAAANRVALTLETRDR